MNKLITGKIHRLERGLEGMSFLSTEERKKIVDYAREQLEWQENTSRLMKKMGKAAAKIRDEAILKLFKTQN
jgi:hypothetical protein